MISEKAINRYLMSFMAMFLIGLITTITLLCIDDQRKYTDMCDAYCSCEGNCSYTFDYYDVRNCACGGK